MYEFLKYNITKREYEVLIMAVRGYSNPKIARELFISTSTVKAHLESIYTKLKVHNKIQASVKAVFDGLVKKEDIR
jgi:DNA-binding NarL/FixJ family response regulator